MTKNVASMTCGFRLSCLIIVLAGAVASLSLAQDSPPSDGTLRGSVTLVAGPHQLLSPGEVVDTLVYFVPAVGARMAQKATYNVYTHDRDFMPEAIAVPQGSAISFVNQDDVPHNVYSGTPGSSFDIGKQEPGDRNVRIFNQPGLVTLNCSLHSSMESQLMVYPSAFATRPAADGSFKLVHVPRGPGTLYFWNPRGKLVSLAVAQASAPAIHGEITVIQPRVLTEIYVEEQKQR
jgi:plastocyanin